MSIVCFLSFIIITIILSSTTAFQSPKRGFSRPLASSEWTTIRYNFNSNTAFHNRSCSIFRAFVLLSQSMLVVSAGRITDDAISSDSSSVLHSRIDSHKKTNAQNIERRRLIVSSLITIPFAAANSECMAVQRAVGSAEQACREAGNCLEKLELDGLIGWNWGGKNRCDPSDIRCGVDGTLRTTAIPAKAAPLSISDDGNLLKITDIINIRLSIGKKESGTLRIGLYGEKCPKSVEQLLAFCGDQGLVTSERLMNANGFDLITAPIRLRSGGILSMIYPEKRVEFGILSQSKAYAKSKRLSKAGEDFVAQPRPTNADQIGKEKSARSHKVAGLVSIPNNGLGYAGTLLATDDEAFVESFGIIASGDETLYSSRKVIGQLIDEESMAFLSRLSSLATVKGLKGFLPGLTNGPPLLPVIITDLSIQINDDTS